MTNPSKALNAVSTPRDFDLIKSLEIFVGVAETGSMTAAASRLRITQSAISQQIKMLETDFGTPLFYRDVRPLHLTPAGLVLKDRADALLLQANEMRSAVRQVAAGHIPHLRIAILSTFARQLAPAILEGIKDRRLPVDNVTITRGMAINHAVDLADRHIDVAWTSDALLDAPGLERAMLVRETYLVVTPMGFGRHAGNLKTLAARLPQLRYSARTQSGQRIDGHLRRLRLGFPLSPIFENSIDLIDAVARGHGWTIVTPSQLFDVLGMNLEIEARPLPGPGLRRTLGLVWRHGELQDTMRQLIDLCLQALSEETLPRLVARLPELAGHFEILRRPEG